MSSYYPCVQCGTEVLRPVKVKWGEQRSTITIEYHCECNERPIIGNYRALVQPTRRLTRQKSSVSLPWEADPPPMSQAEVERHVKAWRWELSRVAHGDEMVTFLNGHRPTSMHDLLNEHREPEPPAPPQR
jgi:hypothetical protein